MNKQDSFYTRLFIMLILIVMAKKIMTCFMMMAKLKSKFQFSGLNHIMKDNNMRPIHRNQIHPIHRNQIHPMRPIHHNMHPIHHNQTHPIHRHIHHNQMHPIHRNMRPIHRPIHLIHHYLHLIHPISHHHQKK